MGGMAPAAPSAAPMGAGSPQGAVSSRAAGGCQDRHRCAGEERQQGLPKQRFGSFLQSPWEGERGAGGEKEGGN